MERKFFTGLDSITRCSELIDLYGDRALGEGYDPWDIVDVHGREYIIQELYKAHKVVRVVASDVDSSSMSSVAQSPGKRAVERWTPAQRTKIDPTKTS